MLKNLTDFLSGAISIYMFLIIIRIVMTWFSPQHSNDPRSVLPRLCDPYLNLFKRMNLVLGHIDFSPIVALTVLVIAGNIVAQIGMYGTITFGIILSVTLKAFWSAVSSLIFIFGVMIAIRIVVLLFKPDTISPMLQSIDSFLAPLATRAASVFMKGGVTSYLTNLVILFVIMAALYYLGNFAVSLASGFFMGLPF